MNNNDKYIAVLIRQYKLLERECYYSIMKYLDGSVTGTKNITQRDGAAVEQIDTECFRATKYSEDDIKIIFDKFDIIKPKYCKQIWRKANKKIKETEW